jgi:flavodoxin
MKVLIAYYSLTGNTKKLAERLADRLGCDVMKIPMFGSLRIDEGKKYDLVLVGTPIWLYTPTFPVSRFLSKNRDRLPEVAFFCTYQTTTGKSFEKMAHRCGKKPLGTLKLMGPEIGTDTGDLRIKQYIDLISKKAGHREGDVI